MNTSPTIGALAAALAKAQAAFPAIPKNKTAKVPTKTGGSYTYDYADLADILDATRPALTANGLSLVQPVAMNGLQVTVRSRLMHSSGEWIEEELTMTAGDNRPQTLGGVCTYGRRYAAGGILGVSPDSDVDGEVEAEHTHRAPQAPARSAPRQEQAAPPARPAAPAHAPAGGKLNPVVKGKCEWLMKATGLDAEAFIARASAVLGRPVDSMADLTLADLNHLDREKLQAA